MVAIRSQDADLYLASPPDGIRLFLLYGNDFGGVTERARLLESIARKRGNADCTIRFGSDELSANPGCIADEVYASSLFGGEPVVGLRVLDGRHNVLGALQPILNRPPQSAWLIVEAGELPAKSPLRRGFEKARAAAAIATFQLEGVGLNAFIQAAAQERGMRIEPAAVELLVGSLGGDRLASRGELDKLFQYVGDEKTVTAADVEAIVGDTAESRTDQIVDAALLGEHELLETGLARLRSEGGSAASLAAQALRHLLQLAAMRAPIESGSSVAGVLDRARPPVFIRRRAAIEAQLKRWSANELAKARRLVAEAVVTTRMQPGLEDPAVSEALHGIALQSRRLQRHLDRRRA